MNQEELLAWEQQLLRTLNLDENELERIIQVTGEFLIDFVSNYSKDLGKTWFSMDNISVHLIALMTLMNYLAAKAGVELPDDLGAYAALSGVVAAGAMEFAAANSNWRLEDREQIIVRTSRSE